MKDIPQHILDLIVIDGTAKAGLRWAKGSPMGHGKTEIGTQDRKGYWRIEFWSNGSRTRYRAHNLIWEKLHGPIPEGYQVDHINRDPGDNRVENLRLLTEAQNRRNLSKRPGGTSRWLGVHLHTHKHAKPWVALVELPAAPGGKRSKVFLGYHRCETAAALARDRYLIKAALVFDTRNLL